MIGWKDKQGLIRTNICMAAVVIGALTGVPAGAYGQTGSSSAAVDTEGSVRPGAADDPAPVLMNAVMPVPSADATAGEDPLWSSAPQVAAESSLRVDERPLKSVLDILEAREADIHDVLDQIALESGLEIVVDEGIEGRITLDLRDVDVDDALRIVLEANDLAYLKEGRRVRVLRARDFEEQSGHSFSQEVQTRMIPLAHIPFSEVGALLNQMKSATGKVFYSDGTRTVILVDGPGQLKAMADLLKDLDVPVVIKTLELRHRRAKDLARDVQDLLTPSLGRLRLDEPANHIIVTDTASQIGKIASAIEALDQPLTEVLIEIKILQIILNDEHHQGVDWEAIVSDFQRQTFEGFGKGAPPSAGQEGGALSLGTVSEEDYVVLLDALDTVGMFNAVSNIRMTVSDRKTGEIILSSDDLLSPYEREERGGGRGDGGAVPAGRQDVIYHITPEVSEDKSLTMRLRPEVATPAFGGADPGEVVLRVREGTTIVVGGLFKDVWVEAMRKIPLLGDLPLVGFAFRNQQERRRLTEVIVFLTPKVIIKKEN